LVLRVEALALRVQALRVQALVLRVEALALKVQALALRVEALALRFWPRLHHCIISQQITIAFVIKKLSDTFIITVTTVQC